MFLTDVSLSGRVAMNKKEELICGAGVGFTVFINFSSFRSCFIFHDVHDVVLATNISSLRDWKK